MSVSENYSLMPHKTFVEHTRNAIMAGFGPGGTIECVFPWARAFPWDGTVDQGYMMALATHPKFPRIDVIAKSKAKVGDVVEVQIHAENSYNKTRALVISFVARRLVCLNGMTLPGHIVKPIRFIHYLQHDWSGLHKEIQNRMNSIKKRCGQLWREWAKRNVTERDREDFRDELCDKEFIPLNEHVDRELDGKPGVTFWDMYNICTAYATHQANLSFDDRQLLHSRIAKYFYPDADNEEDETYILERESSDAMGEDATAERELDELEASDEARPPL